MQKGAKIIDIAAWNRAAQYDNFISYDNPVFSVGVRLDVTATVDFCKRNKLKIFSVLLYMVTCELNKVEELRCRIAEDNKVLFYESVDPNFIVLMEDGGIVPCRTAAYCDFEQFYSRNRRDIADTRACRSGSRLDSKLAPDCFYVSCLPWLDMCAFSNPYNFKDRSQTSIPRITWGRITAQGGRFFVYMDIALHHALADGYHAAKFINGVAAAAADAENYIGMANKR